MTPSEVVEHITVTLGTGRFSGLALHGIGNDLECPLLVPEAVALACVEAAVRTTATPVIGFDDAYTCAENCVELLAARDDVRVIVFVPTFFVGKKATWVRFDKCDLSVMTASRLRSLAGLGVEIGWHGHSHTRFTELTIAELTEETRAGRDALWGLGLPVSVCSFPYGSLSRDIVDHLGHFFSGFFQTCTTDTCRAHLGIRGLLDVGALLHLRGRKSAGGSA